jgi:hypothetical protein
LEDFNQNGDNKILCRIRKSLRTNIYEVINPIIKKKIYTSEFFINNLNNNIWFPVQSSKYCDKKNNQVYHLNENDIIKFGEIMYCVFELFIKKSSIINDDNFNNKINDISNINKKSKSIFNIDIKTNQYKINNNKNNEKVNKQQITCSNENKNIINNESKNESITKGENKFKTITISESRNENFIKTENKASTKNEISYENETKNETNIRSGISVIPQNGSENENEYEYDKCWYCPNSNSNSDINNPLICLCSCHNYIHYECLKKYLRAKITVSENKKKTVTTYRCEFFNCNVCKTPYHLRFRIPEFNKIYNLIDFTLPDKTDYICLESLNYSKDKNNIKTLHIIQLNDQEITIGGIDVNDIFNNDISKSGVQAVLRYNKNNGNLFLEDKNSKFGTLVLVRGNVKIKEEQTYFQIGKIYMEVKEK